MSPSVPGRADVSREVEAVDGACVHGGLVIAHDDVAAALVHAHRVLALHAEGGPERVFAKPHGHPGRSGSVQSQFRGP